MNFTYAVFRTGVVLFLWMSISMAEAQINTTLRSFSGGNPVDGSLPSGITLDNDLLYGATSQGGAYSNGLLFVISPGGSNFIVIHDFAGLPTDGASPNEPLVLNGTIFGTTYVGGIEGFGTIFKLATNGAGYTVLRNFTNGADAPNPLTGLVS